MTTRGVTLIELLVVLVLLALMAGVVGLTLHTARPVPPTDPVKSAIQSARDSAVTFGHAITITVSGEAAPLPITAFPDGRIAADQSLGIDGLTGRPSVKR
ncbi:MAG: prepilin-type N-terminal cleavage/methylation domain-containing protein [Gemmatimonadaceae bacterium]